MADNKTVKTAEHNIKNAINSASANNSESLQNLGETIAEAINGLGEGIKLTVKNQPKEDATEKEKASSETEREQLIAQLQGLRVFIPEFAEVIDLLTSINTSIISASQESTQKTVKSLEENPEDSKEAPEINTSAKSVDDLSGLVNLTSITGTGFSILGNILQGISELFQTVLTGITANDIKAALVTSNVATIAEEKSKEVSEKAPEGPAKGNLVEYLQQLAGPLESIASGILLLSISIAILNTVQLDSQLLGTIVLLEFFMLATFGALKLISFMYQDVAYLFDTKGESPGSITNIMFQFSLMILSVSASIILCNVLAEIIKSTWQNTLIGLTVVFLATLITLAALSGISSLMQDYLGVDSEIFVAINSFTKTVFMIAGVAILCGLLKDIILEGLAVGSQLIGAVFALLLGVTLILAAADIQKDQLVALNNILKTITVMMSITALLVIVLGILPDSIILQGLFAITAILGLVTITFLALGRIIGLASKLSEDQLKTIMGMLITTTVLITILSVLVIVLSTIDQKLLWSSILAIVAITAIPLIALRAMIGLGKLIENSFGQAMMALGVSAIVVLAITGLAYIIVNAFSSFTLENLAVAGLAVGGTLGLILIVSGAILILAGIAGAITPALIPATIALGIATAVTLALTGVAKLIGNIITNDEAEAAVTAAMALAVLSGAVVMIALATIALGAIALPLAAVSFLGLWALTTVTGSLDKYADALSKFSEITEKLGNVDMAAIATVAADIGIFSLQMASLATAMLIFNVVAATLAINLVLAVPLLFTIDISIGLFAVAYRGLIATLSLLPLESPIEGLQSINQSIETLNSVSQSINNFIAPDLGKSVALAFTLNFVNNFVKRLGQTANDANIEKVGSLARNLAQLAQNASGLRDLAGALQQVASATENLNKVNSESKISIEAISNQVGKATEMANLEPPAKVEDSTKLADVLEQVKEAVDTLKDMLSDVQIVASSTQRLADVQETVSRQPRAAFMNS